MRKLLHTSWISALALVLMAGGAVYYCGWTESGLQHLARLLNGRIGPVKLEITGARGTLHAGLHVDRLVVEHERARVEARGLDGRVALLPLLWQTIQVKQLHCDVLQVHVLPYVNRGGHPWKPHYLVGLLNIEVGRMAAGHVELITPGGTSLLADELSAAGQVGALDIRIFDSTLHYAGFEVRSAGTVHAANPTALRGTIRLNLEVPGQPAWLANTQVDGDLNRLGISGVLLAPFEADFHGEMLALGGDFHWHGSSQVRNLDLRAWHAGGALGIISGALQLSGDRHGFAAQGNLEPPGLKAGPLAVDFAGHYAARVLYVERAVFRHRASGAQLSGSGEVGVVPGGPRLDLHGQWSAFRWPLASTSAAVHSGGGSYTLSGLRPFALAASGALQLFAEPPLQFRAAGQLGRESLDIDSAAVDAYGGHGQLRGMLAWSPAAGWSAGGAMHGLSVATLRPRIDGRLSFLFDAAGQGFGKGSALQAKFTELSGQVRGQRASGHAGLALDGDEWLLQQVRVQLGATRIEADGHLGAHPDLRFLIDADDLTLLSNDAHGRLQATGQIGGDTRNPLLKLQASGTGLQYAGITLAALSATIDLEPRGGGHADVDFRLDHLVFGNHTIDHARYTTSGTTAEHQFTALLDAAPIRVQGSGTASFADGLWRARLSALSVSDGADLHLALDAPTALLIALNGDQLRLDHLCLHDAQAMLCAAGARIPGHNELSVSAAGVPLRMLTAGAATDTDFEGTLNLEAHAAGSADEPWTGSLSATLAAAELRHRLSGGHVESFSLGAGKVQAGMDAAGLTASVALDAGADGSVVGHLQARSTDEPWRNWPLTGDLRLQTRSLGFIDSYVAEIDRVSGQLNADLALSGTPAALGLNGELKVSGAEVDAYQINLALRNLNLDARLRDDALRLEGSADAGNDGHARFDGELVWRNALPYGQLHLAGENLRIVNIPEARVQASPDVSMKFAGRRIDITGTVTLPYARLQRPDQFTNAVRASSDEVIVGSGEAPTRDAFHVFSDVTLKLGERVTIDTLGLAGRLSGSVRAVTNDTGLSLGTGEVRVEEGKYTYYGRQLDIQRGRLLFNSGPLSDPAIDLTAIKKFPDITAGVNVRGTLRDPRVTFFSDPAVAQSQIVSLLLAGGSLETVQNTADPAQRTNAARNAALLQGSALVVQQFGSKVGIEDVGVESDLNNDTALVLGRYLSPRLYISYGISLAESINTFKMRYTVGDHWTIKTEMGIARSADLVYTIER
jgi:translocation and assembly module TamB